MRLSAPAIALALSASLLGCARSTGGRPDAHREPAATWHYELALSADLARADATVCFEGDAPRMLRAGKDEAAVRLRRARWLRPGAARRLATVDGHIQLEDAPRDGCVQYEVSLSEGGSLETAVRHIGDDLIASPSVWLWRPDRRAPSVRATLRLKLPDGMAALLPWPEVDGMRTLDADAFRFESYAAFGHFDVDRATLAGVDLQIAVLDGALALEPAALRRYLERGIRTVTQHSGAFPVQRLSVIVLPTTGGSEPVPFGMMARGGAASLLLMMRDDASEALLRDDWVLPHELSHLLLPFVEREHAWLSEGFATYYQELLRARSGSTSELTAMRRIVASLREVAAGPERQSLALESARMHRTHAYRAVYWSGAAFWLKRDVALRARTQNHASLDTLTEALRADGATRAVWSARELLARLDALSGDDAFSAALEEVERSAMPDFEPTLAALGVRGASGAISLDDAAPLADIRRALFAPRHAESRRSPAPPAPAAPE